MTPDASLIAFVLLFWIGIWLFVKIDNLSHGRSFGSGPSFIPAIPVFSIVAICLGWLLNWWLPWLGVAVVVAVHIGYLFFAFFRARQTSDVG